MQPFSHQFYQASLLSIVQMALITHSENPWFLGVGNPEDEHSHNAQTDKDTVRVGHAPYELLNAPTQYHQNAKGDLQRAPERNITQYITHVSNLI